MKQEYEFGDRVLDVRGVVRRVAFQHGNRLWFLDGGRADRRDCWALGD